MSKILKAQNEVKQNQPNVHSAALPENPPQSSAAPQAEISHPEDIAVKQEPRETGGRLKPDQQRSTTLILLAALLALSSLVLNIKLLDEVRENHDSFMLFAASVHEQDQKINSMENILSEARKKTDDQMEDLKTHLYDLNTTVKNSEAQILKQSALIEGIKNDFKEMHAAVKNSETRILELSDSADVLKDQVKELKLSSKKPLEPAGIGK